jgi:ankyrin repeat protein
MHAAWNRAADTIALLIQYGAPVDDVNSVVRTFAVLSASEL